MRQNHPKRVEDWMLDYHDCSQPCPVVGVRGHATFHDGLLPGQVDIRWIDWEANAVLVVR